MKRVLFCSSPFRQGHNGHARFANTVASHEYDDIEIKTLCPDLATSDFNIDFESDRIARLPVISMYRRAKSYCRAISQAIYDASIDLVFVNDMYLAYYVVEEVKLPVVVMLHDYNAITRRTEGRRSVTLWVRRYMEKAVAKRANIVLTNSEYMKGLIVTEYGCDVQRVGVLNLAFTEYRDLPHSIRNFNPPSIKLVFVKWNFKQGGLADLVSAIERLSQYRISLTIVSKSEQLVRKEIGELENAKQEYIFTGPVQRHEHLMDILASHEILCIPSYNEALGVTLAEGLALGLSVVASNAGGIPEVLGNGRYGTMVEPGDVSGLAQAIERTIEDTSHARSRKLEAREYIEKKYSKARMLDELASQLQECQ